VACFAVKTTGVSGVDGEYVMLEVRRGADEIVALHDRLYTGILRQHLAPSRDYSPHITIGRLKSPAAFAQALRDARRADLRIATTVRDVSACSRNADGRWLTDFAVPLGVS